MSYAQPGHGPLDYQPVSYPGSTMTFRGPAVDLSGGYVLCLGGSETFGKFVSAPFPEQLADRLEVPVVNMGAMNAGLDLMLHDPAIRAGIMGADAVVLQIMGAQNMTNRFYRVHPRRNDRFLEASSLLQTIFREIDFTEFHFTRHMLSSLQLISQERFGIVVEELREAWRARMNQFISQIRVPVHLLWMSRHAPADQPPSGELGSDPLFISQEMLQGIAHKAESLSLCISDAADRENPTRDMFFASSEEAAARILPGPRLHERAAEMLYDQMGR